MSEEKTDRYPHVLIVRDKYSTNYYDVSTPELLDRVCKSILRDRLKEGWYEPGPVPKESDMNNYRFAGSMDDIRKQRDERFKELVAAHKQEVEFKISVESCLVFAEVFECKDRSRHYIERFAPRSYQILASRSQCEYESIQLEELLTVD